MNRSITFLTLFLLFLAGSSGAQTFSPVATGGYNFDAVAEATTAAANTTGAIDGSSYVLYSAAYGALYSVTSGLPNSGLIASGTRTYQLQPYNQNNMLYLPAAGIDSISFTSPAAYAGLSLLCFSTEGAGIMNVTVRFTDNTTQVYTGQSLTDWFGSGTAIISGVDRVSRTTGVPAGVSGAGNPKLFNVDLIISCANRAKTVKNVKVQNPGTNARDCIMAISGAAIPSFTAASGPVTCIGGTDGSATVTPVDGIGPFSYTWTTNPAQNAATAGSLAAGVYSFTAQDAGLCPVTGTVGVSLSPVTQPPLNITANLYTVCAGSPVILTSSGASTYTWITAANTTTISVNPQLSTTYTVSGHTAFNCFRTGSVTINVIPLPLLTFTMPASLCTNSGQFTLNATPAGGAYAGAGAVFGIYYPNLAGTGTKTVSYTYTDGNNCTAVQVNTLVVNPLPVLDFTAAANPLCSNSPTLSLSATPGGGTFAGTGVTGSVYTPSAAAVGSQTVSYTYTDGNGCTSSTVSTVLINPAPTVSIMTTKKVYCTNTPSLFLNASPSGGTYSGPGLTASGGFNPATAGVGTHTITYSYTNIYVCTGTAVLSVTVNNCSGIYENAGESAGLTVYPNPAKGAFSLRSDSDLKLTIVNELGQIIQHVQLNESNRHEMHIEGLAPGIYFALAPENAPAIRQKIIITE